MNAFAPPPRTRVALLVDGENLSATRARAILDAAESRGQVLIHRVYGKLADLQARGWCHAPGLRLIPASTAKNSADLLLSVDAMELALDGKADCIVIAASDNDYSHVAINLRERGFPVHGLIDSACPCADLRACYASVTDLLPAAGMGPPKPAPPARPAVATPPPPALPTHRIAQHVVALLKDAATADGKGLSIASLNARVRALHTIRISTTPHKTWRALLLAHPAQFVCDPKGTDAHVRLRT